MYSVYLDVCFVLLVHTVILSVTSDHMGCTTSTV